MIRPKLIALTVGAIAVLCGAGVGSVAVASGSASLATGDTGGIVVTPVDAILSSRVVQSNVLVNGEVAVTGTVESTLAHTLVRLQERRHHRWIDLADSRSGVGGGFVLHVRPRQIGTFALRVEVGDVPGMLDTTRAVAKIDVYHRVLASWYGPGGRTACGQELTAKTLGVANKTLPCGTRVTFRYRNRIVRVRVIDRGPYVEGRDFDLTYATKLALRAGDLTRVWATR